MTNQEFSLGRLPYEDERDQLFRLEVRRLTAPPVSRVTKNWPLFRLPLNQGATGTCVGHGWRHFLEAAPVVQVTRNEEPSAFTLYKEAILLDEWRENDNGDLQFGTSVRAGWKALRARGLVSEANNTSDVDTMANWIGGKDASGKFVGGGLVIGVDWYQSMFEPTKAGFLTISGSPVGGHCVFINGWNEKLAYFSGINSWGEHWGPLRGRFRIDAEVMRRLMQSGGEAWTAIELRI